LPNSLLGLKRKLALSRDAMAVEKARFGEFVK
jgi:hypothetical protein